MRTMFQRDPKPHHNRRAGLELGGLSCVHSSHSRMQGHDRVGFRWLKHVFWLAVLGVCGVIGVLVGSHYYVAGVSSGLLHDNIDDVQPKRAGLVFGCSEFVRNTSEPRRNLYFIYRMDAAAELYKAGKVDFLIVSGDNRDDSYNEPRSMRKALNRRGVPDEHIVMDFAGLRTLDSVIRAREIFGQNEIILISQAFQNERAACIARHHGMSVVGFNAQDVNSGAAQRRTRFREALARVKVVMDLYILDSKPRIGGDPEQVPTTPPRHSLLAAESKPDTSEPVSHSPATNSQ